MKKAISLLLVSTLLASCNLAPNYSQPSVGVPAQWSDGSGVNQDTPRLAFDWWKSFGSDELNQLMGEALNNNLELRAAYQRVRQSRASVQIARADLLPNVSASGNVSNERGLRGDRGPTDRDTNFNGGLDINYELDLFGANRNSVEASREIFYSTKYQYDALALVIMGDVSQTYFNILSAREREKISQQNLENAQEILRIVEARFEAGAASGLEVAQQRSSMASFEAALTSIQEEISIYENALAVLLGYPPKSVKVIKTDLANLQIPEINPSQPSLLLERRPDIASAEADLRAANADIGAARAAFYPSVDLGLGLTAIAAPISNSMTTGLTSASSILAPIFSGGSLLGNLTLTKARQAELVENYRLTVLTSFREVEDAITAEKASAQREASYKEAVEQAQKAYDISMLRYRAGSVDFQLVLDSQAQLLQAQQNYSLSRNERLNAAVDLFKALGGGWQSKK